MSARKEEPLSQFVTPPLGDARLARQLSAIKALTAGTAPPSQSRRTLGFAFAAAAAACVMIAAVLFFFGPHGATPGKVIAGTTIEAPAGGETITLADGSRIVLESESRLRLDGVQVDSVQLALERGGAEFDVTHVEGRQFVVHAKGYEVSVLGTKFSVKVGGESAAPESLPESLTVTVARGRVRVAREGASGDVRFLGAGETWSTLLGSPAEEHAASAPSIAPTTDTTSAPSSDEPLGSSSAAPSASATPTAAGANVAVARAANDDADPKELLARAEAARAAGRTHEAANALNELRLHHRSDARAGLAAFELGRLRMDSLGDPRGAAEAFGDAMVLAPSAPFHEDAEARRIEAFSAAGDVRRCNDAKAAYLARYPNGIHRATVSARCAAH